MIATVATLLQQSIIHPSTLNPQPSYLDSSVLQPTSTPLNPPHPTSTHLIFLIPLAPYTLFHTTPVGGHDCGLNSFGTLRKDTLWVLSNSLSLDFV